MYIFGTNTINIICLNILISIVNDIFNNIQSKIKAIDRKKQAELLESFEELQVENKHLGSNKYLFVISYEGNELGEK